MTDNQSAESKAELRIVRDDAISIIQNLPIDCTVEDIIQELQIYAMIQRGLADSDAGRTISHEELVRRSESWVK